MEWGRAQAGPVHAKQRAVVGKGRTEALCMAQKEEEGPPMLCAGQTTNVPTGGLKRGEGAHPCFVCGDANHRWVECKRRKPTGCPVCGSAAHRALQCAQCYVPQNWKDHPPAPARNLAVPPTNFCLVDCSAEPLASTAAVQAEAVTTQVVHEDNTKVEQGSSASASSNEGKIGYRCGTHASTGCYQHAEHPDRSGTGCDVGEGMLGRGDMHQESTRRN